jgi:hypothetical protein
VIGKLDESEVDLVDDMCINVVGAVIVAACALCICIGRIKAWTNGRREAARNIDNEGTAVIVAMNKYFSMTFF